jgi:excisionase family DNA binding protein
MSPQEKNPHMNKKYIQIESYDSDDFMDSLVEKLTQRIKEECDCCNEADTPSKEWMTTKEACKYFKVSQPTLKRMRDRGEVKYMRASKNIRYLRE